MSRGDATDAGDAARGREIAVRTGDGWTIHLEERPPRTGPARAALVLAPGMMVDRRCLDRPPGGGMASFFAAAGYHVYTVDLRGHGASGPRAGEGGDWTYDEIVAHDVPAAVEEVARRHPGLPRAWVGHSLSAHAGAAALGRRPDLPVGAAVLIGPVVWIRPHEPSLPWWLYKRAMLALWHGVTRLAGRTPARRLGIGSDDEAPGYVTQFGEWARSGRWAGRDGGAAGGADYLAGLGRIEIPVLVVNARGDRWICRTPSVRRFAAAIERAPVTFWELGREELGTRREPRHMALVTDPACRRGWERVAGWLDRTLPPAAGPPG